MSQKNDPLIARVTPPQRQDEYHHFCSFMTETIDPSNKPYTSYAEAIFRKDKHMINNNKYDKIAQ